MRGITPRVRGKPSIPHRKNNSAGITPACAGKTCSQGQKVQCNRDHPRVCGENRIAEMIIAGRMGSPPRVRGKHAPREAFRQQTRITPACAGKTGSPASPLCPSPDHPPRVRGKLSKGKGKGATYRDYPRVCGENIIMAYFSCELSGSPPRVRGKLCQ